MQKLLFYLVLIINIIYTYQYIGESNYIKLRQHIPTDNKYLNINHNLKNCNICKLRVNINEYIPENCTLPIGCPFNRKNIN